MLKYCTRCLYPDTKPRLTFDNEGVCAACRAFEERAKIDWAARQKEWGELCDRLRGTVGLYHCIVPVSGGKDSTWQVLKALESGLRPLAVTAMTDHLTWLGRQNLDNIARLGVDHICVATDAKLRRKINRYTLETVGDISWAEHLTIFSIPIRQAMLHHTPVVMYGENPENEYGGPAQAQGSRVMTADWLHEFGGLNGLRLADVIEMLAEEPRDNIINFYQYMRPGVVPEGHALEAVFMGYYFPWDGYQNAIEARKHGFKWANELVSGTGARYENLDNGQTGIHDYFKYLKFGFGRATDLTCNHIRRGRITRDQGLALVRRYDGKPPKRYVGCSLEEVLTAIGMTEGEFVSICNRFANRALFNIREGEYPEPTFQIR